MKTLIKYIADDGKEFSEKEECENYEKSLKSIQKKISTYRIDEAFVIANKILDDNDILEKCCDGIGNEGIYDHFSKNNDSELDNMFSEEINKIYIYLDGTDDEIVDNFDKYKNKEFLLNNLKSIFKGYGKFIKIQNKSVPLDWLEVEIKDLKIKFFESIINRYIEYGKKFDEVLLNSNTIEEFNDGLKKAIEDISKSKITLKNELLKILDKATQKPQMYRTIEELTEIAYETYCKEVGGKAFNGDPLPSWKEFASDPNKTKQSNAWRSAIKAVKNASILR